MIDINELRRKLQSGDLIDRIDIHANVKPVLTEILDRLEAAEKERDNYKFAFSEYSEKTEWVQQGINDGTVSAKYLGWHRADVMSDLLSAAEKERDALRAELDALKRREGEVVYRWLALDYSGFCYGSNPPDNLPNHCNLKAFYAPAKVAP